MGIVVFVLAHLAQNVWQLFHVDDGSPRSSAAASTSTASSPGSSS
jgi:hypothetical protein